MSNFNNNNGNDQKKFSGKTLTISSELKAKLGSVSNRGSNSNNQNQSERRNSTFEERKKFNTSGNSAEQNNKRYNNSSNYRSSNRLNDEEYERRKLALKNRKSFDQNNSYSEFSNIQVDKRIENLIKAKKEPVTSIDSKSNEEIVEVESSVVAPVVIDTSKIEEEENDSVKVIDPKQSSKSEVVVLEAVVDLNVKKKFENFNSKTGKYVSTLNHKELLARRNELEKKQKQEEEKIKQQAAKALLLNKEKRKKNHHVSASILNVVNETNFEILDKNKFGAVKRKDQRKNENAAGQKTVAKEILVQSEQNLKELANSMNLKAGDLIKILARLDKKSKYKENSILDAEMAELVVLEVGHIPISESFLTVEKLIDEILQNSNCSSPRPPVVTIMGHVDHGKTSLLDAFRKSNIVAGESGGITQHIGAYQIIAKSGKKISFIDTPGHEAFTAIRARGAQATDIVILVVAADDGVMPQTIEAIRHAQAAKVPMIVAVNKIDKTGGDITSIINQLIQYDVITEENGGDVIAVPISAKEKTNLDKLEEAILLTAEIMDLKADETLPAIGVIIESKINNAKGPCATVLVQNGTLNIGDYLITNDKFCKIRSMVDENGCVVEKALPSKAVEVYGFEHIPSVGQKFLAMKNEKIAKSTLDKIISDEEKQKLIEEKKSTLVSSNNSVSSGRMKSIFDLFAQSNNSSSTSSNKNEDNQVKELNFVIKADVSGTLDALKYSLEKLNNNEKIKISIIYSATGAVTESDVMLAKSGNAMICAFNVGASANIRSILNKEGISFKTYTIIYQLIDDIQDIIDNKLKPSKIEKVIGKALVKQVFDISGIGKIAGCEVKDGVVMAKNSFVRIKRKDEMIAEDILIKELKRLKENVREVSSGLECGIALQDYDDLLKGDIFEVYQMIDNN